VDDDDIMDGPRPPLRPTYARQRPPRPDVRPRSVWVLSSLLVLVGVAGALVSAILLADAIDHGDEDVVPFAVAGLVMAALQIASGVGLFVGVRWGRTGALLICAASILLVVAPVLGDAEFGPGQWFGVVFYGSMLFALTSENVHRWTSGD